MQNRNAILWQICIKLMNAVAKKRKQYNLKPIYEHSEANPIDNIRYYMYQFLCQVLKMTNIEICILVNRILLHNPKEMSLQEIANLFECSRENIRQIEQRMLKKLQSVSGDQLFKRLSKFQDMQNEYRSLLAELTELKQQTQTPDRKDILKTKIKDFDFSIRIKKCLLSAGITTIQQLTKMHPKELMAIRNLGAACLCEINTKLGELQLMLRRF